jgi:hypothetical protein
MLLYLRIPLGFYDLTGVKKKKLPRTIMQQNKE